MKTAGLLLVAAMMPVAESSVASSSAGGCPIASITSERELHDFLSLRAVAIVRFAISGKGERLSQLVEPFAPFSLGGSDVGRPLGTGSQGAKALAELMGADTYRFLGWDYMDGTAEPCSFQKVQVEFVNQRDKRVSQVEFTFVSGRVTLASGWERSFQGGSLNMPGVAK